MANFNPLGYTGGITGSTARLGVVQFDPVDFSVSESGVVSLGGTGALQTLSGNSGGNRPPSGGNIAIVGAGALSVAGSGSTLTISLTPGTALVATINSLLPTAGNIIIAGTAAQISVGSSGSTITLSLPSVITAPGSLATTTTLAAGTALSSGTTIIAGTSITATSGAITATNGNLVLNTAGNGVRVKAGTNARIGVGAILSGGTLAVANTSVTSSTVVIPVVTTLGTVTAAQALHVTKNAGVGFTVTSADATDTSTFDWYLVESI